MIYFDAHAHIYGNFSPAAALRHGLENLSRRHRQEGDGLAASYALLLCGGTDDDCFTALERLMEEGGELANGGWRRGCTDEAESLRLHSPEPNGAELLLIAGRQLVTAERLEVLALGCRRPLANGLSLAASVAAVRQQDALAILPWGFGKWLGGRGKKIRSYLESAAIEGLFVGDNGGRPAFLPPPPLFAVAARRGIRLLPGSDPLPLDGEEKRIGSRGVALAGSLTDKRPVTELKRLLLDPSVPLQGFGSGQELVAFCTSQLALRRRSR